MYDLVDFSECEFISNVMTFYTYSDFKLNSIPIKQRFKKLSKNGKLFYKWYVFANTHMNIKAKTKIWNYLNDYTQEDGL